MIGTLECVVLDCTDAQQLAHFYQALIGGEVNRPDPRWSLGDGWATLHTAAGLVLCFQGVEDHRPPRWPDAAHPQQAHLDIHADSLNTAHEKVIEQGATLLDTQSAWRVYADPAGHPFCLIGKP